jgi:hypothetical protein
MTLIDYTATGTFVGATSDTEFLASALDDVAPKIGPGSNTPGVPEPATCLVWAMLAMVSVAFRTRTR